MSGGGEQVDILPANYVVKDRWKVVSSSSFMLPFWWPKQIFSYCSRIETCLVNAGLWEVTEEAYGVQEDG